MDREKGTMSAKARMAAAMGFGGVDRVPVMCQMSIGHMLLQTGSRPLELWHSPDVFAEALVGLRALYGFDGILVSLHGHDPQWERRVRRIDHGPDGERVTWADGSTTDFPPDDLPVPRTDARLPPLFEAFDPASLPARIGYIPVSQGLRFALDEARLFDVFDTVGARAGAGFSIHGEVTSPLDYFLDLFGFEQAVVGFLEDPGRAAAVLDRLTDGISALAAGMAGRGVDAVKISSPYAGAGFLSKAFYAKFVLPFEGRIAAAVRKAGAHAYVHTCGDIHDRLELMAGSGVTGIECLDPPPLGRVDLADAKRRIGGRIFIKGNVDPVHTLLEKDAGEVLADARRRVAVGRPGGGYILSTACSIAPRTPPENVLALRQAVEEAGP